MSAYLRPGIYVRIVQLDAKFAPRPLPLENGFDDHREYEVLGLHCPSETSEAYCILRNNEDQMWFISNRHIRISRLGQLSLSELSLVEGNA
jgi:hypothetical protein